jgi:hypothetical protein
MGYYTNSSTYPNITTLTIAAQFKRWTADDSATFQFTSFGNGNNIKITEISK